MVTHKKPVANRATFWMRFVLFLAVGLLLVGNAPVASALSAEQKKIFDSGIYYFDVSAAECTPVEAAAQADQDLGLTGIATKNDLHSILVQKLGTQEITGYKQNQQPNAAASMIKLIIVDAALSQNVNLDKEITLTKDIYYLFDESYDSGKVQIKLGQSLSVRRAIDYALRYSSNNSANIVMNAAGGPSVVNKKAAELGYKNTSITSYFHDTSSIVVKNNSTAEDIGRAMNQLYSGNREGDKLAQAALRGSSALDGGGYGLKSEANKYAVRNKPPVRGNSGVFGVGSDKFVVTMYTNAAEESRITTATNEVLSELGKKNGSTPQSSTPSSSACCSVGSTTLPGKNDAERIWNFLVGEMDLNNIQAAGIMGNIKQESGFDPNATYSGPENSDAYGIIQWVGGRRTALESFAASKGVDKSDLPMQLEFMKQELESPSYKSTVLDPIRASKDNLAKVTRIWLENYEIPCKAGDKQAECFDDEMNKRMPFAEAWQDGNGDGGGGGGASSPSGCSTGAFTGEFIWPLDKKFPVTSCYGYARGPLHTGLDIGAPTGSDIAASDGGVVEQASNTDPGGFGNTIVIKHGSDKWTLYAHLDEFLVKVGDKVSPGQVIAKSGGAVGAPGAGSSRGPHLHFNIQTSGTPGANSKDPLDFLPKDGRGISGGDCPVSLN